MTPIAEYRDRKDALVATLRSGKYRQGQRWLRRGNDAFCCLGVACAISGIADIRYQNGSDVYIYDGHSASLPPSVQNFYGFRDAYGDFYSECLSSLNDNGMAFSGIADIIDSEPKGLFTWSAT